MQVKLIAVGDSGVGKTSILTRFTYEKFNDYSEPTLGAAFLTKKHKLPSSKFLEYHVFHRVCRFGILLDSRNTDQLLRFTTERQRSLYAYMILHHKGVMMS